MRCGSSSSSTDDAGPRAVHEGRPEFKGVDLTDEAAVQSWIEKRNAGLRLD